MDLTKFRRRPTCCVRIGDVTIGGNHPIAVQSMTNTDTNDTEACVAQIERIDRAGGKIVRLTAQGRREAENLQRIVARLREEGYHTATVADIHFVPEVASIAARYVEKYASTRATTAPTTANWKRLSTNAVSAALHSASA